MPGRALLAAALAALVLVPATRAGYPIQPSAGRVLDTPQPVFLVYLEDGETLPYVEVSESPETDDSGFAGPLAGACIPDTPSGEPHEYTCRLDYELDPGTYYWLFSYWQDDDCETVPGVCLPQAHVSAPIAFRIAARSGPSAPAAALDASFTVERRVTRVGELVLFTARELLADSYRWSFGDGTSEKEDVGTVLHAYKRPSTYTVTLTVAGFDGRRASSTQKVRVLAGTAPAGPGTSATPSASTLPTIAGPSVRSRKDPTYSRIASRLAGGSRAVFCWSRRDWNILTDPPEGIVVTGYVDEEAPRQLNLAPEVCDRLDLLHYRRLRPPPTLSLANAVVTLTHELLHTLGYENEARTECHALQLSARTSRLLGTSLAYGRALARTFWERGYNLDFEPEEYYSKDCKNGGKLDRFPSSDIWPSPG